MQLLHEAESLLKNAAFRTARMVEEESVIAFEDDNLLGFVAVHESVARIVTSWREQQDAFLRRNAARLRRDPSKAWNTYSVFLTGANMGDETASLRAIEEDFSATRKIAAAGIITRDDVQRALSPLMPLTLIIQIDHQSPDKLLKEKLDDTERVLLDFVSDCRVEDTQIMNWLLREPT